MARNVELRVGFLVLLAIAATTFWLLFLKEFKFRRPTFPVYVSFERVEGISVGAPVRLLGVDRGRVDGVQLLRDRVRLTLEIEEGTFVARDARFILQSDFFNPASIRIEQGQAQEAIQPRSEIAGEGTLGLSQLMAETGGLLVRLNILAARADSLTAGARLDRTIGDLSEGARELNLMTAEGRREVRKAAERFEALSRSLETLVADTREPLRESLEGVARATARSESLMVSLDAMSATLTRIGRGLEAGEGSMGRMLESEALYDSLTATIARIDALLADVKAHPKRYFTFELF